MKRISIKSWFIVFSVLSLSSMTSCLDLSLNNDNNLTSEQVNDFQIVKGGLYNTTMIEFHEYICSDDSNHLYVSGPVDDGLIAITITDDKDSLIFNKKLTGFTVFDEDLVGKNGIWTIKLDFQNARGSLDFKLNNY